MDREVGTCHSERNTGENGADQWSMYGLAGQNASDLQGAFVAAFTGLVRGCTRERTIEFLENIKEEAYKHGGKTHQHAMATLIVFAFQLRNCRGGKGEKDLSRWLLLALYRSFPETVKALVPLFPKYGYWKDMSLFIEECIDKPFLVPLVDRIYDVMAEQLLSDNQALTDHDAYNSTIRDSDGAFNKVNISLLAKFIPKEGRSLDKKCGASKHLTKLIFPDIFERDYKTALRLYRQLVSRLNKTIKTTEVLMSEGCWTDIDFNLVPSLCLNRCRRAFLNLKGGSKSKLTYEDGGQRSSKQDRIKCRENLLCHMSSAKRGDVKLKGNQLFIHEIVNKLLPSRAGTATEEKELLELQWRTNRETIQARLKELGIEADQVVPMIDVSGSMDGTPLEVAMAMGIMLTEIADEAYGNRYISFAENPRWIEFKKEWTLREKIIHALRTNIHDTSTDFLAAHDLILSTAIKYNLQPHQLPKCFMVFSDMQFNSAARSGGCNPYPVLVQYADQNLLNSIRGCSQTSSYSQKTLDFQTHHQILKETYRKVGMEVCGVPYELPHTVYWNLRGDTVGFPVQADTPDTQMISGFSTDMLSLVLERRVKDYQEPPTPWDTFVAAMCDEQYDPVHQVIADTSEGIFQGYKVPVRENVEHKPKLVTDAVREVQSEVTDAQSEVTDADMPELTDALSEVTDAQSEVTDADMPELVYVDTPLSNSSNSEINWPVCSIPGLQSSGYSGYNSRSAANLNDSVQEFLVYDESPKASRTNYSEQQVANWISELLPNTISLAKTVKDNGVNGRVMDMVVREEDRESLVELGIHSRLQQNRVFTTWKV
jgi:hypothetical protein